MMLCKYCEAPLVNEEICFECNSVQSKSEEEIGEENYQLEIDNGD